MQSGNAQMPWQGGIIPWYPGWTEPSGLAGQIQLGTFHHVLFGCGHWRLLHVGDGDPATRNYGIPAPLTYGYDYLHYSPYLVGGLNNLPDQHTGPSLSVNHTSPPKDASDSTDYDSNGYDHALKVYESDGESNTAVEYIVEELSALRYPYNER